MFACPGACCGGPQGCGGVTDLRPLACDCPQASSLDLHSNPRFIEGSSDVETGQLRTPHRLSICFQGAPRLAEGKRQAHEAVTSPPLAGGEPSFRGVAPRPAQGSGGFGMGRQCLW